MDADTLCDTWAEVVRTAALVRAQWEPLAADAGSPWRAWRPAIGVAAVASALFFAFAHGETSAVVAAADGSADVRLFSLTNQDRASNGARALTSNTTLGNIGEGARYTGCGPTIFGRSVDMIQRDYFSHQIPPCNQYVFTMMHAYGVSYRMAGENIGWDAGLGSGAPAADYINNQFMHSPDHRANILNGAYTHLGIGSSATASGATWHYSGSPTLSNVWMFSEEFAQMAATTTQHTTVNPAPKHSSPARPTAAATRAPASTPVAVATPTPVPQQLLPGNVPPPLPTWYEGLLPDSVESVLESVLIG